MTANSGKLWKNEYFQTAVTIILIVVVVFGFWYGSQAILNTNYPALAVVSGSMCIPYDGLCNGWDHPFARTLHVGDLLIIQGVNPATLNANYPNSDIIVFHKPTDPTGNDLIVHRIAAKEINGGTTYFYTKGDGNGNNFDKWPNPIQSGEYDPWGAVPQNLVVGKVILRVPWVGHIVLFMHDLMRNSIGWPLFILVVLLLIIIEFILPLVRRKKQPTKESETT